MAKLLKDLLESEQKLADPYQSLVGKTLEFKESGLDLEVKLKIKKVVANPSFSHGHAVNLTIFLDGLNATKNLRQEAKGNDKANRLQSSVLRKHFHGEELQPGDAKEYLAKYWHPYGDKELIKALNELLEGRKAAWSESGLQGKNFINVDVG